MSLMVLFASAGEMTLNHQSSQFLKLSFVYSQSLSMNDTSLSMKETSEVPKKNAILLLLKEIIGVLM